MDFKQLGPISVFFKKQKNNDICFTFKLDDTTIFEFTLANGTVMDTFKASNHNIEGIAIVRKDQVYFDQFHCNVNNKKFSAFSVKIIG